MGLYRDGFTFYFHTVSVQSVKRRKKDNFLSDLNSIVQDPLSDTTVRDSKRNHTCTAGSRTQGRHYARNVYNVSSTYIIHLKWHTFGTYDSKPACKPSQVLFTKTHRYVYAETITKSNGNCNLSIALLLTKKQDRDNVRITQH